MHENNIDKHKKMLAERNKELKCLYTIAEIIEKHKLDLNQILRDIVNIIPTALQFPEKTHTELIIKEKIYTSESFQKVDIILKNIIYEENVEIGTLTIYLESSELAESDKLILPEEISLINYLSERIGRIVQRITFYGEIEKVKDELDLKNTLLERKNIALSEVLNQQNIEKEKKGQEIITSIDTSILPIIEKMKSSSNPELYFDILTSLMKEIRSPFVHKLKSDFGKLTIKEIEICNLLKNQKSTKEIGALLSLSPQTIYKHRDNIRRKLGIKNKKLNLTAFLNDIY